jgi:hypothetical protein
VITDPFHVPYGRLNFDPEMWAEFQKMRRIKELSEEVKAIVDQGLLAVLKNDILEELSFESTFNTELSPAQITWFSNPHWSGLAIAIFSHCSKEVFSDVTKFQKSPYDNLPYLEKNIIPADSKQPYSINRLKGETVKLIVEEKPQLSLF